MPDVAWLAPDVSSSPVENCTVTPPVGAARVSRTVNITAEPSVADPSSIDTPTSSSVIVPTAVAVLMVTPAGSVVPVMVTLNVSSDSALVSCVVCTSMRLAVLPAVIVTLPFVTAV